MLKRFARTLEEMKGLVNDNWSALSFDGHGQGKVLVAVSGGVDSMVMAVLFLRSGEMKFALAHCNFNLRGAESDGDQALVEAWAAENGVSVHLASFDTESYAKEHSVSIEMAARELRYRWFADLCRDNSYVATAVAHNANDNAETLVLNILRGTGMDGICGMQQVSAFPLPDCGNILLIRPMLQFTRKQIEGYALSHGIRYRNDSTNSLSEYKRNRIRNEIFPQFGRINPSFVQTINKDITYFNDASEIVQLWCQDAASKVITPCGDVLSLDIEALMSLKQWRYLLYYILSPFGFNSSHLSSIENLLMSDRTIPGKSFSSSTHILQTGRGVLEIRQKGMETYSEDIMPVKGPGIYNFNGRRFQIETIPWEKGMSPRQMEGVVALDAGQLRFPFVLRRWRNGDWMRPLGMKGRKLLSDIFTDLKFSASQKASAVVIVDTLTPEMAESQHIAALAGLRIDEGYKIKSTTESIIRIIG